MISANFEASSLRKASFIFNKLTQGAITLEEILVNKRDYYTGDWEVRSDLLLEEKCFKDEYSTFTSEDGETISEEMVRVSYYDMAQVVYKGVNLWLFMPHLIELIVPTWEHEVLEDMALYAPITEAELIEKEF